MAEILLFHHAQGQIPANDLNAEPAAARQREQ
jgi:hypothetical protein